MKAVESSVEIAADGANDPKPSSQANPNATKPLWARTPAQSQASQASQMPQPAPVRQTRAINAQQSKDQLLASGRSVRQVQQANQPPQTAKQTLEPQGSGSQMSRESKPATNQPKKAADPFIMFSEEAKQQQAKREVPLAKASDETIVRPSIAQKFDKGIYSKAPVIQATANDMSNHPNNSAHSETSQVEQDKAPHDLNKTLYEALFETKPPAKGESIEADLKNTSLKNRFSRGDKGLDQFGKKNQ
ncbi:MAG: hypothetical protein R2880_14985 [Deinococcales bacterium]